MHLLMGSATYRIGGGAMAPQILENIIEFFKIYNRFLIILTLCPPPPQF